jgi:hypothetical protein
MMRCPRAILLATPWQGLQLLSPTLLGVLHWNYIEENDLVNNTARSEDRHSTLLTRRLTPKNFYWGDVTNYRYSNLKVGTRKIAWNLSFYQRRDNSNPYFAAPSVVGFRTRHSSAKCDIFNRWRLHRAEGVLWFGCLLFSTDWMTLPACSPLGRNASTISLCN